MMRRSDLSATLEPALTRLKQHPFSTGLCDGSLPGDVLVQYAQQDSEYVLPGYARAVARCASIAPSDEHAELLSRVAQGALEARQRIAVSFDAVAEHLQLPVDPAARVDVCPAVLGYTSFFNAASAQSLAAGLGATLPMTWLYIPVADHLLDQHDPDSRYAGWIEALNPGAEYRELVEEILDMVEAVGKDCSAYDRDQFMRNFSQGARLEWAVFDAAWQLQSWPF